MDDGQLQLLLCKLHVDFPLLNAKLPKHYKENFGLNAENHFLTCKSCLIHLSLQLENERLSKASFSDSLVPDAAIM